MAGKSPGTGEGALVAMAAGIVCVVAGLVGGAALAAAAGGGSISWDPSGWPDVAGALVSSPGDPAGAWAGHATGIGGPLVYWSATALALAVMGGLFGVLVWLWRSTGSANRVRFGVDADARPGKARDLKTLIVDSTVPPTGRFLLGRLAPKGPLLATEDRQRHPMKGRAGRRQGSRGSVAIIGPTQAGKTVLLSGGIAGWDGPVVAMSVKRDLYDVTAGPRSKSGELAVFDPGSSTGLATARWTPLRGVSTATGALRAGRALADAIPRNGVQGGDYWAQQGETLASAYMAVAGLSQRLAEQVQRPPLTIQRIAAWVNARAGIDEPVINELIEAGLASTELETNLLAKDAFMMFQSMFNEDERIRASIYATARTAFRPWSEPSVAHSASLDPRATYDADEIWPSVPRFLDLEWLMEGGEGRSNTLYMIAPDTEFQRLAPVLGGLLGDLREQIHAWDVQGRRLPKPLLFVIDEAAQLELSWLPEEVSTIAGLGGLFVTCWQSKSQIDHRYGTLADAVLGGHRSKIILNGCEDPTTMSWLGRVAGTERVALDGWSRDSRGGRSVNTSMQREDLIGSHLVRQMHPGEGVLIHGTLPPAHLATVRWWEDKKLSQLTTTDGDGRPVPPDVRTCPVGSRAASGADTVRERAALEVASERLQPPVGNPVGTWIDQPPAPAAEAAPGPRPQPESGDPSPPATSPPVRVDPGPRPAPPEAQPHPRPPKRRPGPVPSPAPSSGEQLALLDDGALNQVAGRCGRCQAWLAPGAGRSVNTASGTRLVCPTACEPPRHP